MTSTTRPQRADGEATRARILEAAGALFASAGFAEATNKMIAARAGVDMASINYHFGSRNGLYQAVLIEAHRRIIDRSKIEPLATSELPAREKLRQFIAFLAFSISGTDRWPIIVLVREITSPSSQIHVLRETEIAPKLRLLLPVLSEITGIPVGDPALLRCVPCVGAPCLALLLLDSAHSPFDRSAFELPRAQMVDHIHRFVIGGLEAVGEDYRRGSDEPQYR